MDSEDEREMTARETDSYISWSPPEKKDIYMRLWADYEARGRAWMMYRQHLDQISSTGSGVADNRPQYLADFFRVRRFFDTFIGFHTGNLDLTGRWQMRYSSLYTRMLPFLQDIDKLRPFIAAVPTPHRYPHDTDGEDFISASPTVEAEFRNKYKLGRLEFVVLLHWADQVKALLAQDSEPRFQRLVLLDLPPEVLGHILDFVDVGGARLLAATCHVLRELAILYAFRACTLVLRRTRDFNNPNWEDEQESSAYKSAVSSHGLVARDHFLDDCKFILSRDDIPKRIRTLTITSEWSDMRIAQAGWRNGDHSFLRPLRLCIVKVLSSTVNSTELHLQGMRLYGDMVASMAKMTALRTLRLSGCPLQFQCPPSYVPDDLLPTTPIENLLIDDIDLRTCHTLTVACFFPKVKTLVLQSRGNQMVHLPSPDYLHTHNPFASIERLHIENLGSGGLDFPHFVDCLRRAAAEGSLRLTHFMFAQASKYDFGQEETSDLLTALRNAPLEVLVFSGLTYIDEDLFAGLADAVPGLTTLALLYRHNDSQDDCEPSRWPGTTHQYASYLAAFPRLKTFAWNYRPEPSYGTSPSDLRVYEDQSNENISVDDEWECLARLFSAHAPTLRSLVFLSTRGLDTEYRMTTDVAGEVAVEIVRGTKYDHHVSSLFPTHRCGGDHPWFI